MHILILDWQVLCTAVHASVQHRISLYTAKSLHKEKIDRVRELERGRINGTLRYKDTGKTKKSDCSPLNPTFYSVLVPWGTIFHQHFIFSAIGRFSLVPGSDSAVSVLLTVA